MINKKTSSEESRSLIPYPFLLRDTESLHNKSEFLEKVIWNFKDLAFTKFHQIERIFFEGRWIHNQSILGSIEKSLGEIEAKLKKYPEEFFCFIPNMQGDVLTMLDLCEFLREAGAKEHAVDAMQRTLAVFKRDLDQIETYQISSNSSLETIKKPRKRAATKAGGKIAVKKIDDQLHKNASAKKSTGKKR